MNVYLSWRLSFPGSGVYTGDTPTQLLNRLSKRQFDPDDRANIKAALAWRAWVMRDVSIDPSLPDEEFLLAFGATGIATLEVYSEEKDQWLVF